MRVALALLIGSGVLAAGGGDVAGRRLDLPEASGATLSSPTSSLLTFVTNRSGVDMIVSRPVDGGPLREIAAGDEPQWSPDGRRLLYAVGNADLTTFLRVLDADTGQVQDVGAGTTDRQERWSPNGRRLLYVADPNQPSEQVHVVDADGGHDHVVANGEDPSWSPDGTKIALRDVVGRVVVVATASGRVLRSLAQPSPAGTPPDARTYPVWSPDGRWIAVVRGHKNGLSSIVLVSPDGRARRTVVANAIDPTITWSPDSTRLAFAPFVYTLRTAKLRRLPLIGNPLWSPDGRWLASASSGTYTLTVVRPDGTDLHTIATNAAGYGIAWSPDSQTLAIQDSANASDVWVVALDGDSHPVSEGERYGYRNGSPAWAPPTAASLGQVVSPAIPSDSRVDGNRLLSRWPIGGLAADGDRVAVSFAPTVRPSPGCTDIWSAGEPAATRILQCGRQNPAKANGVSPTSGALAGDRFWAQGSFHEMGTNMYTLNVSTPEHPRPIYIDGVCANESGGVCTGTPIGDVVAADTLAVFDGWTGPQLRCNVVSCPPPKHNGVLYRIDGTHAVAIASADDGLELTPLDVDGDHILVNRGAGGLSVYDRNGYRLLTVPLTNIDEGALAGNDLVARISSGLEILDSTSGARLRTCALPETAHLDGAAAGLAAVATPDATEIIRLTDCRTTTISAAPPQPDLERITSAGLFYVQANSDSTYPFQVDFVPTSDLVRELGP